MKNRGPEELLRPERPGERRLVYRYSPRRTLIITGIFMMLTVSAGLFFLLNDIFNLSFIMGIFTLTMLISIRKQCSVRIWVQWPYLIYEYRSLFRHVRETIAPWDISGLTPNIVSMWRGNISERLVMEVGDRDLVVTPHYSESDPAIIRLRQEIYALPDSRKQAEYEIELERRTLHPEEYREEEPESTEVWGFLEMSVECPRCDGPVAVNGPYTELVCPQCSAEVDMKPSIWADLLEDVPQEIAEDYDEGYGSRSTIWGVYNTALFYGRMRPCCPECERDYDLEKDTREDGGMICPDCGHALNLAEPPEWWSDVFPDTFMIAGAEVPSDESNLEGDLLKGPVVFTCEKCGAGIRLDGSDRDLKCDHCDAPIHIPDDLWLRFHPPARKNRWFIGYRWTP